MAYKANEISIQKFEQDFNKLLYEFNNTDYKTASVWGTTEGFKSTLKECDEIIEFTESVETTLTELAQGTQPFQDYSPDMTKEELLFPSGSPTENYKRQLEALQYSSSCVAVHNNYVKLKDLFYEYKTDKKRNHDKVFESSVYVKNERDYSAKTEIIDSILQNTYPTTTSVSSGIYVGNFKYEEAQDLCRQLNENGIEACVANKTCSNVLESNSKDALDNFNKKCSQIAEKCQEPHKDYVYIPHGILWKIFGFLWIISIPAGTYTSTIFNNIALGIILNLIPVEFIVISYLICLVKTIAYNIIYNKEYNKFKELKPQVLLLTQQTKSKVSFDIFNVLKEVDKQVVSTIYEKCSQADLQADNVYKKLVSDYIDFRKIYLQATHYLPKNLDFDLLPSIVDIMGKGAANDYASALRLAEDSQIKRQDSNNRLGILAQIGEQLKLFQTAQANMTKHFEQERLIAAREQAESQKRSEQYAKEQAEAAQRQAKAAESAAESAKQQAEDSKELLRKIDKF